MNVVNYQKEMEREIQSITAEVRVPTLMLHSCCAPCSTHCIEQLAQYFQVTVFYYNPNIYPPEEYEKRAKEQQQFLTRFPTARPVRFLEGEYDPAVFYETVRGYEKEKEGGERCFRCYALRLGETAKRAAEGDFEYFTTTLTISPLKNAAKLNEIGQEMGERYGVKFLPSDFKKKNGYKRSTELSREYDMYRQNYCGCVFSIRRDD